MIFFHGQIPDISLSVFPRFINKQSNIICKITKIKWTEKRGRKRKAENRGQQLAQRQDNKGNGINNNMIIALNPKNKI